MSEWKSSRDPKGPMHAGISLLSKQKVVSADADNLLRVQKDFPMAAAGK